MGRPCISILLWLTPFPGTSTTVKHGTVVDSAGTCQGSWRSCQQRSKVCCEAGISILVTSTGAGIPNSSEFCKMDILNPVLIY